MAGKKPAKLASRSKTKGHEETVIERVMLSGPHRVTKVISGKTDCGEYMNGWRWGDKADVACSACLTPNG